MIRLRELVLKVSAVLAAALFVGLPGFFAFDNEPPYSYLEGTVFPDPAPEASQITVHWKLKMNRMCPGAVQRQLIDSRGLTHTYDAAPAATSASVRDGYLLRTFLLPQNMPRGLTKYRANVCYVCNPLQLFFPLCKTTPEISFILGN